MKKQNALELVRKMFAPKHLSYIEEIVLLDSWEGKLYREIAQERGYEEGYLKDIGSRLWLDLSENIGREVTKKTFKVILSDYWTDESLPAVQDRRADPSSSKIDFPGYPLPFGSGLYVQRSPIEDLAIASLNQAGSLIRIKASQGMGKTSLINHVMGVALNMGMHTVFVDVQQADTEVLGDIERFLRWFCWNIGQQLNLEPKFDDYWFESAGSKLSCTT
jgi:hypothetical protein